MSRRFTNERMVVARNRKGREYLRPVACDRRPSVPEPLVRQPVPP